MIGSSWAVRQGLNLDVRFFASLYWPGFADGGFRKGDAMRSFSGRSLTFAAAWVLSLLSVSACTKVGQLKAMKTFKAANQAYQAQDYKKAAQLYEETIQDAPDSEQAHQAYFFLGNSYDQLYKPSKKGDPANDDLLNKAARNYQLGAEKLITSDKP